jgi:vitamin B12 transporter
MRCSSLSFAALLALSPIAQAASDAVVVTATRQPTRASEQLSDVSVLDRSDLERLGGGSLATVLAQLPGVQITANGGLGKQTTLSIRGMESRHVLLLIDGVRYNSGTTAQPALEALPLEVIDHIEVVRGPLSSLYGSEAGGGVIQVFTRQGQPGLQPNASVGVGSHRYEQVGAGLGFGEGAWSGLLQANRQRNKGFSSTNSKLSSYSPDDDGYAQSTVVGKLGYQFSPTWRAQALAVHNEGKNRLDESGLFVDPQTAPRNDVLSLVIDGQLQPGWATSLRLARTEDELNTLRSKTASNIGITSTVQRQLSWENRVQTGVGSLLLLAERLEQEVGKPGANFSVTQRQINGLALGLDGHAGPHTWQASLRHDSNSQFGSPTTGSLAYGFDITPQWRVGASAGTYFLAPSFNQLYFPGFGNANLQPERGRELELNAGWHQAGQEVKLTAFQNRVHNYIVNRTVAGLQQPVNIDQARIRGLTLGYQGVVDDWTLSSSLDWTDPRNVSSADINNGKWLPRRSKTAAKAAADRSWGAWSAGADVQAFGKRYDDDSNTLSKRTPGFTTADLRADWRFMPDWTLQARLNNLADKRYETIYGYNQPGRELYLSLRWAPR